MLLILELTARLSFILEIVGKDVLNAIFLL